MFSALVVLNPPPPPHWKHTDDRHGSTWRTSDRDHPNQGWVRPTRYTKFGVEIGRKVGLELKHISKINPKLSWWKEHVSAMKGKPDAPRKTQSELPSCWDAQDFTPFYTHSARLDTTNVPHRSWWANFATLWGATSYHIVATPHAMESRHTRYRMYPYYPLLHGDTRPL